MYQFSEMFKELQPDAPPPTYRWRSMGIGLVFGWAVAWTVAHYLGGGAWGFAATWLACPLVGYFAGSLIKK